MGHLLGLSGAVQDFLWYDLRELYNSAKPVIGCSREEPKLGKRRNQCLSGRKM